MYLLIEVDTADQVGKDEKKRYLVEDLHIKPGFFDQKLKATVIAVHPATPGDHQ